MSGHNQKTIKQAIEELLKTYHLDDGIREVKVKEIWNREMGKVILKHTVAIYLRNHVLHVRLNSSVVRQELSMMKTSVINDMNEQLGEKWITDLYLL